MLWAACTLGFFGFLRSGKMVSLDDGSFDPGQHLSFTDISVDDRQTPSCLSVRIKQSKTDPFRPFTWVELVPACAQWLVCWRTWRYEALAQARCFASRMIAL